MAAPRPEDKTADIRQEKGPDPDAMKRDAERMAKTGADVSERAARVGFEVVQKNNETAQQVWDVSAQMASQITHQSANQLGRIFGLSGDDAQKSLQDTSKNVDAIAECSRVILSASQDITRQWLDTGRSVMEHSIGQSEHLVRCRTPHDLLAVQTQLMSDNLNAVLNGSRRVSEISARVAQEAMAKMSERTRAGA